MGETKIVFFNAYYAYQALNIINNTTFFILIDFLYSIFIKSALPCCLIYLIPNLKLRLGLREVIFIKFFVRQALVAEKGSLEVLACLYILNCQSLTSQQWLD